MVVDSSSNIVLQLFRYTVAGGSAFIVDFSLLWFLRDKMELPLQLSVIIAYIVGLIITYLLSIFWIFDKRQKGSQVVEFTIFSLIGIIGLGLTSLFMWIFTDLLDVYYMVSKLFTTAIVFIWNFVAKKKILF